jgi:serine/threonine-protein kinase RsbW
MIPERRRRGCAIDEDFLEEKGLRNLCASAPEGLKRVENGFFPEPLIDFRWTGNLFCRFDLFTIGERDTQARIMPDPTRHESEAVERLLDSTLASVDHAEEIASGIAQLAGFDEDDLMKIGIAVREAVVNAVVHGNRYNENKKVRFSVVKNTERFTVRVADEGEGFDFEHVPDPLAPENLMRASGRGIFLMRSFMDELEIRRLEPGGTELVLTKYKAK